MAVVLLLGYSFFPESPHWLLRKGRREEALKSLKKIHGFKNDAFYSVEVHRIEEEIRISTEVQRGGDTASRKLFGIDFGLHIECFRGTNLKRTMASILVAWAQQVIGAPFVVGYSTYFLELIGIISAFNASVALYVLMVVASSAAFPLTEIVGRRTMLVGPQFVLCFILLLIGIMGCVPDHTKANWAIVVFMYLWTIIFQMSISATGFVIASEIATMRLRAATQGMVTIFNAIASLVMSLVMPYLVSFQHSCHITSGSYSMKLYPVDQPRCGRPWRKSRIRFLGYGFGGFNGWLFPLSRNKGAYFVP
jgi:hypothetical protein